MIYRGSNQPIILEVDESVSTITKLSCVLYNKKNALKHWTLDDVTIDTTDCTISLPLSETETMAFPACKAELEVKWLEEGNVEFAQIMPMVIIDRRDTTLLVDEGDSDES